MKTGVSPTFTCLYCRETKGRAAFNREHVLPTSFGTFSNNFVLRNKVCRGCNSFFSKHLELALARDSIEGLDRYSNNLRTPSSNTHFGRAGLLSARVDDGGFFHGASVCWRPSRDGRTLVLWPLPQFGIADPSGRTTWFPVDELPSRTELHALGFQPGSTVDIKPFGIPREEAEQRLRAKGYSISSFTLLGEDREGVEIDVAMSGTIDHILQRAVAKIAFNYFAYHHGAIAMMEQFDEIRQYVRYARNPTRHPVSLSSDDFLAGLTDQVPVAHGVGVSWKRRQVVAQVTLFFRFHYRIVLADDGFLVAPQLADRGHLFDPINQQIVELTSDPRRGRPMPKR